MQLTPSTSSSRLPIALLLISLVSLVFLSTPITCREDDQSSSPSPWSSFSAAELGQRVPYRWRSYLPEAHPQSRASHARVAAQFRKRPEAPDRHYEDDQDDEYDGNHDDQWTSANDEERHLRAYLRYKAQSQGRKAYQAAKIVGEKVKDGVSEMLPTGQDNASASSSGSSAASSSSAKSSSPSPSASHPNSIAQAVSSLFRLAVTIARLTWLSIKFAFRYAIHAVRVGWNSICYAARVIWSIFLTIWASMKYLTRQVLRPIRVAAAPIIYIYLGTKWVFWDVPTSHLTVFLRETYPLYVFTGAGLALGTLIGIGSAIALWVGAHLFNGGSSFESSLTKWGSNEVLEWQRRPPPRNHETVRESLERTDIPDYLRGLGSEWRPLPRDELKRRKSAAGALPSATAKSRSKRRARVPADARSSLLVKSPEEDFTLRTGSAPGGSPIEDYFSVSPPPLHVQSY